MSIAKRFNSGDGNVRKYIFEFDGAIAEAVLYQYESFKKRTVLCVSVQSGCPVGCSFCGTGKHFIRNLTPLEITGQVKSIMSDIGLNPLDVEKYQIMFMSMGEPFLNYINVARSIEWLHRYAPNAELLVSTMAPAHTAALTSFIELSKRIDKIGLQFSVHAATDGERNIIIPYLNKLSLLELREYGIEWWKETGRKPYVNYCVQEDNDTSLDFEELRKLFPPNVFCMTFSVVCDSDETMKLVAERDLNHIQKFEQMFIEEGYNTRIFDPDGQDDIGGGCGQLWYTQEYMKNNQGAR
jgi:23S rRNA (adenine2503-C2)-methyltransferase